MKGSMSKHRCLRCKTVPLIALEPIHPEISFFECSNCRRQYALKPGKALTFRWMHPISLALYEVIFDAEPVKSWAAREAALVEQVQVHPETERLMRKIGVSLEPPTPEQLELIVSEIRLELEDPTQQVRDILDCRASEDELREWLRRYAEHVERILADRRGRARGANGA